MFMLRNILAFFFPEKPTTLTVFKDTMKKR